eukprot:CAMPEP_0115330386 /NCGR_PEP_ID=MMETSP0270-20121206/85745_1 /TAXON_ID=71861 /ORGANISM="Scrippsiella trochoidea, Strain CCMP3099" /LENGTH=55 /DNA_ID=CAMNT_0002751089 /DNA_START=33 /DNA_END=197 /DNA_ORIENTATION=-
MTPFAYKRTGCLVFFSTFFLAAPEAICFFSPAMLSRSGVLRVAMPSLPSSPSGLS